MKGRIAVVCLGAVLLAGSARGDVYNLKVVTDASPDYSDMDGLVHSITGGHQTTEEKLRALFYWNHIARRQTMPMMLHGTALTDPIRQFNDYGYTMCSTISGINCSIWDAMGLRAKYWDISNHTVAEVEYDGRWHMFDNSLSALYTLCDGKTLAGVEDIGAARGCAASGGKVEPGHIARYHCLFSTSPNGFLTGADTIRSLDEEYRCFNPNGLKYRSYFYDWDRGHRYILNLREGEAYTRHYRKRGDNREYFVPNDGKDPDDGRFGIRGNGERTWIPPLTPAGLASTAHSRSNIRALPGGALGEDKGGRPGEVIYKVEGANVLTSLRIRADFLLKSAANGGSIAVSTTNGLQWRELWRSGRKGADSADLKLVDEVNGSYEALIRVTLWSADAVLKRIEFSAVTMLNSKTQPQLNLGRNEVYIGAGDQTESTVFWPDLQGENAKPYIVEQKNVTFQKQNPGFQGTLHATRPNEEAYVVFRMDTPGDLARIQYGGRLYNRARNARIEFLHSFDGGKTWVKSYELTETKQPWDVIRYETITAIPRGTHSALLKYRLNASEAGPAACSIYSVRMEANYLPPAPKLRPLEVTFNWSERQADYSLVEHSHTQLVNSLPARYVVNVGGADHPVVNWLRVKQADAGSKPGYSDGKDAGGEKFVYRRAAYGKNLAEGRSYTLSIPSETQWEAGDPDGRKLTDGMVGPTYSGGVSYRSGAIWSPNKNPVITVDMGESKACASFGLNVHGYPAQDALKGEIKDTVEVFTSQDEKTWAARGPLATALRRKDVPINFMLPDCEELMGATLRAIPPQPVEARYVQYRVTNRRFFCVTEIEVLDSLRLEPFDLSIALPTGGIRISSTER